jgi:hypothetical protein
VARSDSAICLTHLLSVVSEAIMSEMSGFTEELEEELLTYSDEERRQADESAAESKPQMKRESDPIDGDLPCPHRVIFNGFCAECVSNIPIMHIAFYSTIFCASVSMHHTSAWSGCSCGHPVEQADDEQGPDSAFSQYYT